MSSLKALNNRIQAEYDQFVKDLEIGEELELEIEDHAETLLEFDRVLAILNQSESMFVSPRTQKNRKELVAQLNEAEANYEDAEIYSCIQDFCDWLDELDVLITDHKSNEYVYHGTNYISEIIDEGIVRETNPEGFQEGVFLSYLESTALSYGQYALKFRIEDLEKQGRLYLDLDCWGNEEFHGEITQEQLCFYGSISLCDIPFKIVDRYGEWGLEEFCEDDLGINMSELSWLDE